MATGPVEVLDGLIKGIIFVAYDFVRLTVLGFCLPFLKRTRRIWPLAIALGKRFSSLTYLAIWIFIVVAFFSETAKNATLSYLNLTKNADVKVPALIVAVLLTTMLSDILVRAGAWLIGNRTRRKLYESLARIAVANIFFGMFLVIAAAYLHVHRNPGIMFGWLGGPFFTFMGLAHFNATTWLRYPYFPLFGISLAIVIVKAFAIRGWKRRILVGLPIMFLAPVVFLWITVWLYLKAFSFAIWLSPPAKLTLYQQSMRCSYVSDRIHASGLLKLEGADTQAISPRSLAVLLDDSVSIITDDSTLEIPILLDPPTGSGAPDQKITFDPDATVIPGIDTPAMPDDPDSAQLTFPKDRYLGRGDEGQRPIVLLRGRFTSVIVIAASAGGLGVVPSGASFKCKLGLVNYLSDPEPVTFGEPIPSSSSVTP